VLAPTTICPGVAGVYTIAGLAPGLSQLTVQTDASHLGVLLQDVAVRSGETTRLRLQLHPAGAIALPIGRLPDGSLPRVCAFSVPLALAAPSNNPGPDGFCNFSGSTVFDTLTLGPVPAGPANVFVRSLDLTWGAQWLGATGGTGDRRLAAIVPIATGLTATAPTLRLDPAGEISGVVRSRATGQPIPFVCMWPFGRASGLDIMLSSAPAITTCANEIGVYRMAGLGPYSWPVEFSTTGYANVWSGGATDRFHARYVPVRPGDVTTLDAAMDPQGLINLRFRPGAAALWSATAYHPVTGDRVSFGWDQSPPITQLNTGPVIIRYTPFQQPDCWYWGPLFTKQRIPRPTNGIVTAKINTAITLDLVPGVTCGPSWLPPVTKRRPVNVRPHSTSTIVRGVAQDPAPFRSTVAKSTVPMAAPPPWLDGPAWRALVLVVRMLMPATPA